jgi:ABC-type bacteriocin/lantibiotic exporter with double-glycine peptidase domain
MHNIYLIKRSFIRQSSQDTCGIACLGMILNYTGKHEQVNDLNNMPVKAGGLSLFEMQAVAFKYNLSSRSVEMELAYLRSLKQPCILHTQTEHGHHHYQVCYGSRISGKTYEYLMADPAKQVYFLSEEELDKLWVSKAALYFESLSMDLDAFRMSPWASLLSINAFPSGFWVVIPMLTLCSASFGIAMSWVLQKGITNSYFLKTSVFIAIIILLFLISLFKSLFAFLRQYLLIRLNMAVNHSLMSGLIQYLFRQTPAAHGTQTAFVLRNNLKDIQKIQNALSEFIATVISEGSLILVFLTAIVCLFPLAALVNLLYFLVIGFITYRGLPKNSFYMAHLHHLSATTESFILQDLDIIRSSGIQKNLQARRAFHESNHALNLDQTKTVAVKASVRSLINEIIGTINVIAVFTLGLWQLQSDLLDYSTFMLLVILSYLISSIVPKICNALAVIADGGDASVQLRSILSSS